MSSLPDTSAPPSRRIRRLLGVAVTLAVIGTSAVLTTIPARADSAVSAGFTIRGAGWGHGWGMSQYGAYGAARQGSVLETDPLLLLPRHPAEQLCPPEPRSKSGSPPTTTAVCESCPRLASRSVTRLGIATRCRPERSTPRGASAARAPATGSATGPAAEAYVTKSTGLTTGTWSFSTRSKIVKVVLPNGSVRPYRGTVALIKSGTGGRTINDVLLEDYVKGVVPAEMPTSWAANAVRAQAVAARSYAVRLRKFAGYSGYDICDTTACQVYRGMSRETTWRQRSSQGHDRGHCHLPRRGGTHSIRFVQWWAHRSGRLPVPRSAPRSIRRSDQVSGLDPILSASSISRAWPSVGTVKQLQITSRDGAGAWGGRVEDDQDHRKLADRDCLGNDVPANVRSAFLALHGGRAGRLPPTCLRHSRPLSSWEADSRQNER